MKDKLLIIYFVSILMGVGFLNLFLPNKELVSELENRSLATFPEFESSQLFSGDYFQDIESYYSDHFFNREKVVLFSQNFIELKGIKGKDKVELITLVNRDEFVEDEPILLNSYEIKKEGLGIGELEQGEDGSIINDESLALNKVESLLEQEKKNRIIDANDLNTRVRIFAKSELELFNSLAPIEPIKQDSEIALEQLSITENEELTGKIQNNFLVINDAAYELFGYSESSCEYYANSINDFASQMAPEDKVYSIIVPSHIEFVPSSKYREMADSQAEATNYINSFFTEKVDPVNIYTPLAEHSTEYLYFRSDHHWTALGAYYAYTGFAEKIGDIPYELDSFERIDVEGFLGTLYDKTLSSSIKENPDTVSIYMPFVDSTYTIYTKEGGVLDWEVINMGYTKISNKYMAFLSGDNPLAIIDTDLDNGKKIMVFKDSYGNAFIPYLMSHYDEIHIIDPRHYDKGAITYAKEHDIHEFLFINYAIVIAGNVGFTNNIYKVSY